MRLRPPSVQPLAAPPPLRVRLDRAILVRSLAILGVVFYHACTGPYGASAAFQSAIALFGASAGHSAQAMAAALPSFDRLVSIFFLVAGYFAHRAFQRSRAKNPGGSLRAFVRFFLWRRFFLLVPAFWAALLFSYFVSYDRPFSWDGARQLIVNASLLKTLCPGYFFSINHAHWFVAAQWQLDLLYPLFLVVVLRRSMEFAVAAAWTLAFAVLFVLPHFSTATFVTNFPLRWVAEWTLGAYLAHRHLAGRRLFPSRAIAFALVGVACVAGSFPAEWEWLVLRLALATAFELLLLSRSPRRRWERALAPVGGCSYALYLLHIPLQTLVGRAGRALGVEFNTPAAWLAFVVVSTALSLQVARWTTLHIEQRSVALGNRLWRRRWHIRGWWHDPEAPLLQPIRWIKKEAGGA